MKRFQRFDESDRRFIKDNLMTLTNAQIGAAIGRSESSISWQVMQMGLSRGRRRWNLDQIATMRVMAATFKRMEIAKFFNTSDASIKMAFKNHGISTGRTGRFPVGNVSTNKGKKMPAGWGGRGILTRFKRGQLPHNTLHDGAI